MNLTSELPARGWTRVWEIAAVAAALLFAAGAPFSIFLAQTAIVLAMVLALTRLRHVMLPLRRSRFLGWSLAFYFLVQLISIIYSQHPLRSLICFKGDWPVLFLPIFLALFLLPAARRAALPVFLGAASLAGGLGLWQHIAGFDPLGRVVLESDGTGRFFAIGSLGGHLTYGGIMMLGLIAAFTLLLSSRPRHRVLLLAATALCAAGLVASYARSAWFGAAMGLAAGVVTTVMGRRRAAPRRGKWLRTLAPGALILAAVTLLLLLTPGLRTRLFSIADMGWAPRIRLWGTALGIFSDFPLFGAGLGSFKTLFSDYQLPGQYMATGHPHNDALNVMVHSGLAGLLAWIGLWVAILRTGSRAAGQGASGLNTAPGGGRSAAALLWAVVVGFLAAGLAQCYFTDEEPVAALWFLVAMALSKTGLNRTSAAAQKAPPSAEKAAGSRQGLSPEATERGARRRSRDIERRLKEALLPLACRIFIRHQAGSSPLRREALPDLGSARKILLIRQDSRLGNLVLITPFLQALRQVAPQARIGAFIDHRFAELLDGTPWVDEFIIQHRRRLIRYPWTYPTHLANTRRAGWDIAFELSNPDTHSFLNTFAAAVSGAPLRVGFDHPSSRNALSAPVGLPETECHFSLAPLLLLSALGATPPVPRMRLSPALATAGKEPHHVPAAPIVLHAGGRGRKAWPLERFAALIEGLQPSEREKLIVIGGPGETQLLGALSRRVRSAGVLQIKTPAQLVSILAGAHLYIGCDAGPLHVAAALGTATLAIFIASHPLRYAPLGEEHETILLGEVSRTCSRRERFALGDKPVTAPARLARIAGPEAGRSHAQTSGLLQWDAAFGAMLAQKRPRMTIAPCGLDARAEVAFVLGRVRQALVRAGNGAASADLVGKKPRCGEAAQ